MTILTKGGACSLLLMMLWMGAVHIQPVNAQSTGGAGEPSPEVAKRPNVLLVMTDDQGWGDVYSHGNYKLDTPAMDRLATQGARFNRFYVSPVCAPTRASLMTGRYYLRTGVADVTRGFQTLRANEVTLAEVLGQAGYTTGLFGKWHLGEHYPNVPRGQGFDQFIGFLSGHWNDNYDPALLSSQTSAPGLDTVQTKGYINNVLTDAAIEFMEGHRDEPFLNFVSYNTPHSPYQVPDSYFQKYQERGYEGKTAAVYGMVDNLDDHLGRLLNALERWPGQISPSQTIRKRAAHIDLLPTLADLTGVELTDTKPPQRAQPRSAAGGGAPRKFFKWEGSRPLDRARFVYASRVCAGRHRALPGSGSHRPLPPCL
jgi:arylsulfatase A